MNTIVLWTLVALLTPLEAEKGGCPANCFCSTDNLAVKCRGLEKFPVFDFSAEVKSLDFFHCGITEVKKEELHAYTNLESLDLRYNELKSISPGLFSEITKLRELYIANNPWSCDKSSFILMQTEITALVDSNKNLEDFDGGKVECFDPPSMKGRRPLHLSNPKTRTCHVPPGDDGAAERHAARITAGAITMSIFVLVLLTVIIAGIWACRERIPCIRRFTRSKETSDSYGKMGAGGKSPLLNKMAKNQPVIEVLPRIPSHYDGRTVDFAAKENTYGALDKSVLIKNKKRFDKIQALPVDAKESANLLREKMAKKLHTVQVLPVLPKNFVLGQLKRTADFPDSNRGSEKGTLADKQAIYEKIQGSPVKSTEKKTSPLPSTMEKKRETLGLPLAVPSGASGPGKTLLGVTQPVGSHIKQSDRSVSVDSKERLRGSPSRQTHAESSLFIGEESGVFDSNKIQKGDGKIAPDKKTSLVERVRQRRLSISHSFHDMSSNSSLSEGETGAPHRKRKTTKRRSSPSLEGIDESLKERIKDRRRMSQALPELSKSSISSLEEDGECKFIQADSSHDKMGGEEDLIDSTKKRRRMSQGLPVSAQRSTSSSEDDEEVKSPHTLGVETQELGGSESTWLEGIKIIIEKLVSAVKVPGTLLLGEGTSSTTRSSLPSTDLVRVQVEDADDKEIDRESEKESEKESDDDFPSFHSLDAAENETD